MYKQCICVLIVIISYFSASLMGISHYVYVCAASEIDVPVVCGGEADMPVYWWDAEADKCLLVGVFKHGVSIC